jgi:glutamyl-tRNA synthetase
MTDTTDQPANQTVTRFAPSPTGHLHIGGARTALFCAAYAGGASGRFVLRIEDTDQKRSSEAAAAGILDDLVWLGITWDDGPTYSDGAHGCGGDDRGVGPFYQSQRREHYGKHLDRLIDAELAYPAFETPEELAEMRKAAEAEKKTFIYRRPADYDHAAALKRAESEEHVIRFRMPEAPVTVRDEILGEVTFPYEELDDLVIRKKDGFPTYHFAVVVDDELMGVTHVVRGQEHLNNTPRHIALMNALGFRVPVFAHLPLIFNADGSKMSKRDKDKAVRSAVKQNSPDG